MSEQANRKTFKKCALKRKMWSKDSWKTNFIKLYFDSLEHFMRGGEMCQ